MKENTKQILKVSICTLMALVLFAGVILMCVYFAFDYSNCGVAKAYTDEEVGVTNILCPINGGFYVKNLNYYSGADIIEQIITYYTYFIPNVLGSSDYVTGDYSIGSFLIYFLGGSNFNLDVNLYFEQYDDIIYMYFNILGIYSSVDLIYLEYNYQSKQVLSYIVNYSSQNATSPYNYFVSTSDSAQTPNTFINKLALSLYDTTDNFLPIASMEFVNSAVSNFGCLVSTNETFAIPPVVMPEVVYDDNLQDKYNEGYDDGLAHYLPLIQSLQQEKTQLQQQITSLQQEKTQLQQQITTLQLEKSQLQQDNFDLQQQITTLQQEKSQLQQQITELQRQVSQRDSLIEELREEIDYYESLDLNLSTIEVFNPARMKSSTFVYDGVTYTSNSIVSTDDGWDVYSSTYHDEELPPNYGVGFSLFLPEYITNTKFYLYGYITGWYNYTYCSEPDEQGNQQCYQVADMISTISVGYRNQNGNIVKVGTFMSNLPGAGGVDFFIDSPTNEIVFFVENCNLMEVDRNTQVIYYYFDTESIYNDGYENGKSQGIKIGREEGYYQGVADANDYSFFSLFTSVFDAPITAIVGKWGDSDGDGVYQREGGMLNFYIPGLDINFAPFLLSLFTIAIIILVIRFVMARKS